MARRRSCESLNHIDIDMRPITREHFLWALVVAAAAAMRIPALDFPLADAEASAALAALQTARGGSATLLNPLFGFLQSVILMLFGDSNTMTRVVSLVGGLALCLWPIALRGVLGRARALMMAALLCISPTMMFVGREALGGGLAWLIAAAMVGMRDMRPVVRAILLGLLLACGVDAVAPLLVVLLMFGMTRRLGELRVLADKRALGALAAAFAAGATGFLLRPAGLADAFEGWTAWLRTGGEVNRLVLGVAFGEMLAIVFALVAGVRALMRRVSENHAPLVDTGTFRFGAAWISAGLVALLLLPGRSAATATAVVIGAAVLASEPLTLMLKGLLRRSNWVTWATAGLVFVLLQFVGIGLRNYAMQNQTVYLLPVAVALVMTVGVLASAALNEQTELAMLGIGAALALTLGLYVLGIGVRATQIGWADVSEPYRAHAPQPGLATLRDVVREASVRAEGEPDAVSIFVDASAPASLRWVLRNQAKVRYGIDIGTQDMLLLPSAKKPAESRAFVGSRYRLERMAALDPTNGGVVGLLRWLLYRQGGTTGTTDVYWTLWVSDSLAADMSGRR